MKHYMREERAAKPWRSQIVLGVLGLGMVTKYVPNSVMTGFLTGTAIMIILGQLWDLVGYSDELGGSA